MEKISQVKLTIFEPVFKGYHECSFAIIVAKITLFEGKGGDWGPALKLFEENNRGQLGHLQCTMQTGVCALALDWLVQLSSEIKLPSSVIELTEKFLFDYVRLPNQLANNWISVQTQSSSIEFDWFFIRIHSIG